MGLVASVGGGSSGFEESVTFRPTCLAIIAENPENTDPTPSFLYNFQHA